MLFNYTFYLHVSSHIQVRHSKHSFLSLDIRKGNISFKITNVRLYQRSDVILLEDNITRVTNDFFILATSEIIFNI